MSKRVLTKDEKETVVKQQISTDGSLRCFISGEIIDIDNDNIEYDHLIPYAKGGATDIHNMRVFLKKYNKEKGKTSLEEYKKLYELNRLYDKKNNKVKLQDILSFKNIETQKFHYTIADNDITLVGNDKVSCKYPLFFDSKLEINYFYAQLPIVWLINDDKQGLQPRVIDKKRLTQLYMHLKDLPQLAPSIARLVKNEIKLFDGQHKLAAQILNGNNSIDVKVYIAPENEMENSSVYEKLLKTNLDAHSKLAQIPFYTNTLFQKWDEMSQIKWDEYVSKFPDENHTESSFFNYLLSQNIVKAEAKKMFEASIIKNAHDPSDLKKFTAESNKDNNYPLSQDLLKKTIFKHTLFLTPSNAAIDSESDFRDDEKENFRIFSKILIEESGLAKWTPNKKSVEAELLKIRRIWHKGSVLTWSPHISSMINAIFKLFNKDEQDRKLYRKVMTETEQAELRMFLNRLFNHPFWDQNDITIDKALTSSSKVSELIEQHGLTFSYIQNG